MESERTGQLLDQIGQVLAQETEETEETVSAVLLYAMLDFNMVGTAIFEDRGDQILYRRGQEHGEDGLTYPLLELWEQGEQGKRWEEIEYVIRGGKFDARFIYPEEIDRTLDHFDRRDQIVRHHFGDKPIVYPPVEELGGPRLFEL